jgi:hypothetical protein
MFALLCSLSLYLSIYLSISIYLSLSRHQLTNCLLFVLVARNVLLPLEIPFIYLKAPKEEHIFTDQAYISVIGESATSAKRLVSRYAYKTHPISMVEYETAGMGMTDKDCELKFVCGSNYHSVDVIKTEVALVIGYFKVLNALAVAQVRNQNLYELAKESFKKLEFKIEGSVDPAVAEALTESFFIRAQRTETTYNPDSYESLFRQFIE